MTTNTSMPEGKAQQIGRNQGSDTQTPADKLALFLKVFGGEVLTAFARQSKTLGRVQSRTIASGKSAQFPVMGRTSARYLKVGENLDDGRSDIKHSEKVITIDGLLATDVLIYDIEDAMNHYDVRSEYSTQMGEAMAIAADCANYAEMAKLCNNTTGTIADTTHGKATVKGTGTGQVIAFTGDVATDPEAYGKALLLALTKARAAMTKNYVPSGDRTFFTDPDSYSAILAALMPNSANYAALIDAETGNIRNVMGFEVVETPHMTQTVVDNPEDTNPLSDASFGHIFPATGSDTVVGADNVAGMCIHRSAVATLKLKDMALERARRAEYQADQIISKYAMGHGGLRPEACVGLVTKKA